MSQWMATCGEGNSMEWWWKVYGCSVWDVWKIFREGIEVRWVVEGGENGRTKTADVLGVRADGIGVRALGTSVCVSASFAERKWDVSI